MDAPSQAPAELSRTEQPHKELPRTEQPRTVSGKRPSEASLQREREFMCWLSKQDIPEGDTQLDDTWAAFMAERRARREKAPHTTSCCTRLTPVLLLIRLLSWPSPTHTEHARCVLRI